MYLLIKEMYSFNFTVIIIIKMRKADINDKITSSILLRKM